MDTTYLHSLAQIIHEQVHHSGPVVSRGILVEPSLIILDFRDGSAGRSGLVRRMEEGNVVRRVLFAMMVLRHELPVEGTGIELFGWKRAMRELS
jgi:hypothetical protein